MTFEADPRPQWSRKVQDFHPSDPAVQAALAGEEYFDVTPGHLASSALETGYFATVEDCLDFFGLAKEDLKRTEPFEEAEIDQLVRHIEADADDRLRPDIDRSYIRWAEGFIAQVQQDGRAEQVLGMLKGQVPIEFSEEAAQAAEDIAEGTFDSDFNRDAYDERHLRLQVARAISLLERDGFAITLGLAMKSLETHGFVDGSKKHYYYSNYPDLEYRLATAALYGTQLELHDGVLDPQDFDLEEAEYDRNFGLKVAYDCYSLGAPIVIGVRDLITFAQVYASPDELPELAADRKVQALTALVKNSDERISQIRQITPNLSQIATA